MTAKIVVIAGVTAASKTAAAIALAKRRDGELVGADSMDEAVQKAIALARGEAA